MPVPTTMAAVLLTRHGGPDALEYRTDVPVPTPRADEVLVNVEAAALNNTDINTRIGWYSKSVRSDTAAAVGRAEDVDAEDASWSGVPLAFPRIQGADVAGRIVAVGTDVPDTRIGERVLVRNLMRHYVARRPFECWTLGSDCDGGFAQYVAVPADEAYRVESTLTAAELGAIPVAYSTAEGMLHRAGVGAERVLVTGASGGVGLAAVQLAKLRGAEVVAVCSPAKADAVRAAGADRCVGRDEVATELAPGSFDVVVDVVGGDGVATLLTLLRRGGRYAIAGAIAGALAEIDLRTVYLGDLTLFGCTYQDDEVFENLVRHVDEGAIHPHVARTYPLRDIGAAQEDFMSKGFVGKLVLLPPPADTDA